MVKKVEKKKLVLLDAHAIIHRAYHALPDFTSEQGEPTGALYGLSAMLLKIISDLKPDYLIACYDLPEPTHRHEIYKEYKAGRAKVDDELVLQLQRSRDVFKAFSIPMYDKSGFEADDIIGTIVEETKSVKNLEVVIASGDMDTLQLVNGKRVKVYTLKKGIKDTIVYDEDAVIQRFGFVPTLLPDYKGLRGDPSDNIIGIPGIGEKTATILIKEFGSIENIYKKLKKDEGSFLKVGIKPRIITLLKDNKEEAVFSRMLGEIRSDAPIDFLLPKEGWGQSFSIETVLKLFATLNFKALADRVKRMFQTTKPMLFVDQQEREIAVDKKEKEENVDVAELQKTAIALWLLSSEITNPNLEDILTYTKVKKFTEAQKILLKKLKEQSLYKVYSEIEVPLIPIIKKMEDRGILINVSYLKTLSKEYHQGLSKLEKNIYKYAGCEFNINSPKQLGEILFDQLNLVVKNQKRTGTGQKSTRESELEKMKDTHPIIKDILSYRELQKLLSTYIDNLPARIEKDGRLHARFLQTGTTTGRMSSQGPNLQNIPVRTDLGRKIRNAFIASVGFKLVAFDYSQIELRVAAFLSGDEKLIEIFKSGGDVHTAVAAEVFDVPAEMVDEEMRRRAKVINFGILYGMGVNALRQNLGTTRAEAQTFYDEYFKNFSGLAHYIREVKAEATRVGYTDTFFGRRRSFEGLKSFLPYVRAASERMAFNAPIQGTEADIIKLAMVQVDEFLKNQNLEKDAHLLLQVHDELVYEVCVGKVDRVIRGIQNIMESVVSLKETKGVPICVDVKSGKSWGELKQV